MATKIEKWMLNKETMDSMIEFATQICDGVTEDHYKRWLTWNVKQPDFNMHPCKFAADISRLSYEEVSSRIHKVFDGAEIDKVVIKQ